MAKLESTLKNMVLSLTLISLFMSAALGFVFTQTKDSIEKAKVEKDLKAISQVVPSFDSNPLDEKFISGELDFYPAKKDGQLVGVAVKTFSDKGFSGKISIMVGFLPDGTIHDIAVLDQKETPGLGTKMKEPKFKDQFKMKNPTDFKMLVKKDGGNVDAITAATITSRAFCDATQKAFDEYMKGGAR